nr:hypothetical protein [Eubacterium sp.]
MTLKKGLKKAISIALAAAMAVGLAVTGGGKDSPGSVVYAAENVDVPDIMDSSSQVNYSTILGRGVDFGIIADEFYQCNHMQSTFAVKTYKNNGQNNDINLIASDTTAQVLVGGVDLTGGASSGKTIQIGSVSGSVLNIECTPGLTEYFDISNQDVNNKAYINENPATSENVQKIMDNAYETSGVIANKANDSSYAINYKDYSELNGSTRVFDFTDPAFDNKVIYINVDNDLLKLIGQKDGINIKKNSSSIIIFNIDDSAGTNDDGSVALNGYTVKVDGNDVSSTDYAGSAGDSKTGLCDSEMCQKIIWNVRTTSDVSLQNTSGLFIIPNSPSVDVANTSAGWIVANELTNTNGEWHYIYQGGNQDFLKDGVGEIHFAARKAFTHAWDGEATVEDTTIYAEKDTYSFKWFENNENFSKEDETDSDKYKIITNTATDKLQFPTLSFYTDRDKASEANDLNHYIENEEVFYYTVREMDAGKTNSDGIYISNGKIDIKLTVKNNKGHLEYYVDTTTYLDDGTVYKENNNIRMSGIEFSMGPFFNLSTTSLVLKKSVTGDCETAKTATFECYVRDANGNYYDADGKNKGNTKTAISINAGGKVEIKNLPAGKYTVSENLNSAMQAGYTLVAPETKEVSVGSNATPVAKLVNDYTQTSLKVSKEVKGLVDENDIPSGASDWEYKFYVESKDYTNPQMYIGENGELTSEKYLFTVKVGNDFAITPLVGGEYEVVEDTSALSIPEHYVFSKSYDKETVTLDADNKNDSIKIVNTFRKTNDLSIIIDKEIEGVDYSDEEYEFYLSYTDGLGRTVYVDQDGNQQLSGNEFFATPVTKENASTIKVKAGQPLKLTNNGSWTSGIIGATWGSNNNGVVYTIEEVNYDTPITYNGNDYFFVSVDGNKSKVTLKQNYGNVENQVFVVTNNYQRYDLEIEKKVNLSELEGQEFEFVIKDPDGHYLNTDGSINYNPDINYAPRFIVKAGEKISINGSGVHAGQYTVTEVSSSIGDIIKINDNEYELKSIVGNDDSVTLSTTNPKGQFSITNNYEKKESAYGKLTVSKTKAADSDEFSESTTFPINIMFDKAGTYWVNGSAFEFKKDIAATFNLTVGNSVEITKIPVGVGYSVSESLTGTQYQGFDNASINYSDTDRIISSNDEDVVTVENKYKETTVPKGSLKITKSIDGLNLTEEEFEKALTFKVKATINGETKYLTKDGCFSDAEVTFTMKEAGFTKNATSGLYEKSFSDLPYGKYEVEEVNKDVSGYKFISEGTTTSGEATISTSSEDVTVAIVDKYEEITTGSLKITKSFDGDNLTISEFESALTFKVTTTVNNETKYVKADGSLSDDEVSFTMAEAGFAKNATSGLYEKTFENLPLGVYTVEEVNKDVQGYIFKSEGSTTSATAEIKADEADVTAAIVDKYEKAASIKLTKTIEGLVTDEDLEGLTFTVNDGTEDVWTGTLGDTTKFTATVDTNGNGTYVAEITNLDASKTYNVTETLHTFEGYDVVVSYKIGTGAEQTGTTADDISVTAGQETEVTYKNVYTQKTTEVTLSKKAVNGTEELVGAELKITSDAAGSNVVKDAKTGTDLIWTSGSTAKTVSLADGTYYMTETTA